MQDIVSIMKQGNLKSLSIIKRIYISKMYHVEFCRFDVKHFWERVILSLGQDRFDQLIWGYE